MCYEEVGNGSLFYSMISFPETCNSLHLSRKADLIILLYFAETGKSPSGMIIIALLYCIF